MTKDILKKEQKYPNPKQFLMKKAGLPEGNYGQPRSYVIHDGNDTGTVIIPTADCFWDSDVGGYPNHPPRLVLYRDHPDWKNGPYKKQLEHIRLVEKNGYRLQTFPIARNLVNMDVYGFASELTDRKLVPSDGEFYYAAPLHVISPAAMEAMVQEFANWLKTEHPSLSETTCDRYADELRLSRNIYGEIGGIRSILQKESIYEIRTVADLDAWTPELLKRIKQLTEPSDPILGTVIKRGYYREFLQSRNNGNGGDIHSDTEAEHHRDQTAGEAIQRDETTQERMGEVRLGQDEFRTALLGRYGVCLVTGIDIHDALIASHIKPWRACNDTERLDFDNGLLLAAHVDKLFDKGYISFYEDGKIMLSEELADRKMREKFGITDSTSIPISEKMEPYMAYHRDNIFKGGKK